MSAHLDPPLDAVTLIEIAQLRARATPDDLAYCFLVDGEEEGPRLTYAELDRAARALATTMREVAQPGDRALLLYEPGIEFIPAFLGCLYAQIIPVPTYPPRLDRLAQSWSALARLEHDCQPRLALTTGDLVPSLARGLANQSGQPLEHWIATDQIDLNRAGQWHQPTIDPEATAFLQYTSGSTSAPRGVVISHRNMLHNERMLQTASVHSGPGLGVCWLPLHHDMGLLGGVLQALFHGAPIMLMSPLAMVQRPLRWLQAISRYRADTSGGPNFAYEMCVDRITDDQKVGLDLSTWTVASIGAEPINPKTLARFTAAFAPWGFRPEAFNPSYGLAEATLFVASGGKYSLPVVRTFEAVSVEQGTPRRTDATEPGSRALVGCGHTWMNQELAIVDLDSCERKPEGSIGEIWVRGPSIASGYWNRPEETERTFGGRIEGERSSGESELPFLRTGDLGFVYEGELFVTGRCKEILIIRGRNYYPQDIEATAQSCNPALRPGGGAVFESPMNEISRLILVQELDRKLGRLADQGKLAGDIRQIVAEVNALQLHDIVFLEPGTLPRTTSGKIQRYACRQGYENGMLRPWRPK